MMSIRLFLLSLQIKRKRIDDRESDRGEPPSRPHRGGLWQHVLLRRARFAKQHVAIFKPTMDVRYSPRDVVSHDHTALRSIPVHQSDEILKLSGGCDVVGIDEAQFFDDHLVAVCNKLAYQGVRVIIAGLDMDFLGNPFGPMPALMAVADEVTKVHAICVKCGV